MTESFRSAGLNVSDADLYRLLMESVEDYAILLLAPDGSAARWNAGAERLFGYPEAEIIGQPATSFFTAEDQQAGVLTRALKMARESGRAEDERWYVRKDGTLFWSSTVVYPIRDGDSLLPLGYIQIVRDLTERKRQEQQLHEVNRRLEAALNAGEIGTWTWDIAANRVFADKNLAQFFSVTPEDADGGPIEHYIRAIHPDDRATVEATIATALQNRVRYEAEYRLVKPDSSVIWVNARGKVEQDAQGKLINLPGVVLDITAQRAAELARQQAQAQIENLNARLRHAVQETHHRIKNNLQIISALADVELESGNALVPATALSRIKQHTRALATIHDMLAYKPETGFETTNLSTAKTLAKLLPLLLTTAGGRNITYQAEDFLLSAQQTGSLCQLINELVSNALQHGQGDVELTLNASQGIATLEVCDDGPGFPDGFDRDKAAHIGLKIIDVVGQYDLRGTVSYENRPQRGARVRVTFPLPAATETVTPEIR